jgi:hypothetical protein
VIGTLGPDTVSFFWTGTRGSFLKGMAMKRLIAIGLLAALSVVSLLIAACGGGVQAEADRIDAAPAKAIEMGIDPETTGNTASTLGALESCARVDVPSPSFDGVSDYNIDVYVRGDTQAPMGYSALLVYSAFNDGCPAVGDPEVGDKCLNSRDDDGDGNVNDGCPQVGASAESGAQCDAGDRLDDDGDAIVHVADPGTDYVVKFPNVDFASADARPDSDGTFNAGAGCLEANCTTGTGGDGTLVRVGLDIGGSGLVTLALDPPPFSAYTSAAGDHPLTLVPARLAINQDCPAVTPTPTSTPAPTPTSTSTPGTPTPTPPPGTVALAGGWNNTCYVGAEQPIQDALADVAEHVVAAYRTRADQGFDRWFPNRPDVSTIAAVSPYQPLFILMDQSVFWPLVPSGTPPTSASLTSGWNSVCYTGQTKSAGDATAGVAGGFVIMYRLAADQGWSRYVPGRPDVSDLLQLDQFAAVLMLVNQEGGTSWAFGP